MQEKQNIEIYEDEIDLREIFLTLWRRKWLIAGITFAVVLVTALYSIIHPKIYEVFMVVEPGIIDVTMDGKYDYLDTADNIKGKIESNSYFPRILKALHLTPDDMDFVFKANIPRNANVLVVSSEFQANKTDFGLRVSHQLLSELQNDYAREVRRKKDEYQKQILMKKNQISEIEVQRKDLDQQIGIKQGLSREKREQIKLIISKCSICERRESDLLNDLKEVKGNTQRITSQRDQILKQTSVNNENGIADLLYSTTIQQNMAFFNELKNQIDLSRIERENYKSNIKDLEKDINENELEVERLKLKQTGELKSKIDAIGIELEDLQNKISQIQNIKTISEPTVSSHPVKPKTYLNIFMALIGGTILGIFLAFILEYASKAKGHYAVKQ
jgi:uncharacterized protein involved in exopolysaccharide biosynthesis